MKLNIIGDQSESLTRGPGRRLANLLIGLARIGADFEVDSDNFDYAFGLHASKVFNRWPKLPDYTPIGCNVMHNAGDHTDIAKKFKNFVVQSAWVAEYWKWQHPVETAGYNFYIYPASVDLQDGFEEIAKNRKPSVECLFYTKYQNGENREIASSHYRARGHSAIVIEYGKYTLQELKDDCSKVRYAIYNSCCEKSAHALLEILACDVPVYVIESSRWIGDDKFDRCTSAPHFSDACGMIGLNTGRGFDDFYDNVLKGKYDPHGFIRDGYTVEHAAKTVIEIVGKCHP